MIKNILISLFLFILHISLSYSLIVIVNQTKVSVHCDLTNSINFNAEIAHYLKQLPLNATELKISCNVKRNISLYPESFRKNLTLTLLHFDGLVFNILPNSFRNLRQLSSLSFDKCVFSNLQVHMFGELYQLQYLNLSSNSLTTLNEFLIPQSSRLRRLTITNNNISSLSKSVYRSLLKVSDVIDIRNNPLKLCHCINQWIYLRQFDNQTLLIDNQSNWNHCNFSDISACQKRSINQQDEMKSVSTKSVYSFQNVIIDCPIKFNKTHNLTKYWIGPHNETFGSTNDVRFIIQPLFTETIIHVDRESHSLNIIRFRGYFRGNWTCVLLSESSETFRHVVTIDVKVHTKEIFDLSIAVGFSFAGVWLLIAICVGLVQYCRETSCCRHKIDYNTSNLFEKRYVRQTVIPVPIVDSLSSSLSLSHDNGFGVDDCESDEDVDGYNVNEDSSSTTKKPLQATRPRYDCHNNDVQLIFKDQELANEYAQMLSQLKEASETGDENFKQRLTTLRTRFSIDFNKMRFELKRGMESLRRFNSSAAAHKLRKSVGHMKDHMKSFTEFCGTSSSMAQSISIVVISSDSTTSSKNVDTSSNVGGDQDGQAAAVHKKQQIFRFFEPL